MVDKLVKRLSSSKWLKKELRIENSLMLSSPEFKEELEKLPRKCARIKFKKEPLLNLLSNMWIWITWCLLDMWWDLKLISRILSPKKRSTLKTKKRRKKWSKPWDKPYLKNIELFPRLKTVKIRLIILDSSSRNSNSDIFKLGF